MGKYKRMEWVIVTLAALGFMAASLMVIGCSEGGDVSLEANANSGSDQQNNNSCTQTCGCNDGGADASCCPGCSG